MDPMERLHEDYFYHLSLAKDCYLCGRPIDRKKDRLDIDRGWAHWGCWVNFQKDQKQEAYEEAMGDLYRSKMEGKNG